jgi:hypothetical protein
MTRKSRIAVLLAVSVLALLLAPPSQAQQACVTFEPPFLLGTVYGAPVGQASGDLAFTSNLIRGYVYNFRVLPAGTAFNRAYIDFAPVAFSPGQSLRTNNINLLFDFTGLAFKPSKVIVSYLDLGGYENLAVNGSGIYAGELTAAPPFLGGATVTVTSSPLPPPRSGKTGTVTIRGAVQSLLIGGQELWIDNVCAQ